MSILAFLCNLWPARRRKRRDCEKFMRALAPSELIDAECPHCHFVNLLPPSWKVRICVWCGEFWEL